MRPPPSRYKVVERGRRLEVIDTRTGAPVVRAPAPSSPSRKQSGAGIDSDVLVTRRWYDDKAPRAIRINYATRARLLNLRWGIAIAVAMLVGLSFLFWPLAVFLVVALVAGPKLRAQLRAGSTSWLDGLDQAA
ncbi:hypothetical protein FHS95_002928 [Sphingomonas naasensis]|uniref:Uncharacterized protein n=1 Tax=Sphingomonas naasensis TaxID=1344951 RepID=A0A4S1W7G7_9SPHN|nr:hypothetical protein [Sphingomonas naasensis]NIJ21225.1 hypothetical protein [Sphingomonas naasensis]TGX38669.1 hypothetical protein E5A74_17680 [Sphingomonas naasensis]